MPRLKDHKKDAQGRKKRSAAPGPRTNFNPSQAGKDPKVLAPQQLVNPPSTLLLKKELQVKKTKKGPPRESEIEKKILKKSLKYP